MISKSEKETREIAKEFSKKLKAGKTICLYGELGSGKTFFTKNLAAELGISPSEIKSPTFTLQREYNLPNGHKLVHIDLYRIQELDELLQNDLQTHFENPKTTTIIEWADRAENLLPKDAIKIKLSYISPTSREITISQ